MTFSMRRFARPAAFGAFAVSAGALGLYLLIAFGSRRTATGGIDTTNMVLALISAAVPIAGVIVPHLVFGRLLLRYHKEYGEGS